MRAVLRWGVRLFRQDWRQQTLVMALLTFAVAAALFCSIAVSNAVPQPTGQFGNANLLIHMRGEGPRLATQLDEFRRQYGTIEVIGHAGVPVPGSTDELDFRAQQPNGAFSAPMLRLLDGRYPSAGDEIALTQGAAADFHTHLGATLPFAGATRRVVGLVENPAKLDDDFALGTTAGVPVTDIAVLARGTVTTGVGGSSVRGGGATFSIERRDRNFKSLTAAIVLLLSSVLLILVALVATASFAVVAHRRQRQLGMLASVGATDAQLRLVMLSNGFAAGAVGAVGGAAVGLGTWFGVHRSLEHVVNHRLGALDLPWWLVFATSALALLAATGAAWWPARAVTRVPVTEALSGRPPQPATAHRSLVLAVVLLVAGCFGLGAGVNTVRGDGKPQFLIPGAIALIVGVLVLSPLAIRAMSRVARRAPLAIRLALRDLNRYQARSGAALAAISLGIGLAVCTVVVATVAKQHFDVGNLPASQLVFSTRNDVIPSDAAATLRGDVDQFVHRLHGQSHVYDLDVLMNTLPNSMTNKGDPLPSVDLARRLDAHSFRFVSRLYVATPDLLAHIGVQPAAGTDILTTQTGAGLTALVLSKHDSTLHVTHYTGPQYRSGPTSFITAAGAAKLGLPQQTSGWLVEADHALSGSEVRAARTAAASVGLRVESRSKQASLLATRTAATAVGVLLALALLAMTIGLIRSEAGRDLQTLVATGASSFTRRALTASTSASLALLGSLLGIGGAYLGLTAIYLDRPSDLSHPPIPELAVLLFGLPLLAAGAGWLLSGREPVVIVRHALD